MNNFVAGLNIQTGEEVAIKLVCHFIFLGFPPCCGGAFHFVSYGNFCEITFILFACDFQELTML